MKKFKRLGLIVVLCIVFLFSGCNVTTMYDPENSSTTTDNINDIYSSEPKTNDNPPIKINLNEPFQVGDIMSITLYKSEWCEEILPSNTTGVYSYMSNQEGEKYFVIRGELKNFASEAFDIEYAGEAQLIVDEKYKFSATMKLEENDGTSFYGNVKPLQTLNLIIYASVSDEVYEICKNAQLNFEIVNTEENLGYYYDEDYPHSSYYIVFNN